MASKQARGTKRTCQNSECGARFYDLNRSPIVCPICESGYAIASAPLTAAVAEDKVLRKKRTDYVVEKAVEEKADPEVESEDALDNIEVEEEGTVEADDQTFLEEEEEGGDVGAIIRPVEGEEEV